MRSLVALVVIWASPVRADEGADVSLTWSRGDGTGSCLEESELRSRVETRLARSVFANEASYSVSGELRREAGAFVATLTLAGPSGVVGVREVRVEGADCSELNRALPLVVAMLIDLREEESAMVLPETPEEPPPAPTAPQARPRDETPWRVHGTASARGMLGLLPNPAIGAIATIALDPPFGLARLALGFFPDSVAELEGPSVRFVALFGGIGFCPLEAAVASWTFRGCADLELGFVRASGRGLEENATVERLLFTGWLGAETSFGIGRLFFLYGALRVGAPLVRNRFVVAEPDGGASLVHEDSYVLGALELGVGVAAP